LPRFKLTLAYDGTAFVGWQRQAAGESIQGLLELALAPLEGRPVVVAGAGRTDAGVHALGQVASVTLERIIDGETLLRAVNARLPPAVRVLDAVNVPPAFHARFNSTSKIYRYRFWNARVVSPFERPYVWHVPSPVLDVGAMAEAAALLVGTHDFAAFQGTGAETHTSVRTVFSSRIVFGTGMPFANDSGSSSGAASPLIAYEICGDGFLRHMVRTIAGTLMAIGRGRRPPSWMSEVIASRSRMCAGETAPASGLFLVSVAYETPDL
jgi:tRNA pseudouridine38-40 synthase